MELNNYQARQYYYMELNNYQARQYYYMELNEGRQVDLDRINNKLLKRNFVAFLNVDYSVD